MVPGTGFLEDSFSTDPGWLGGGFGDDSGTSHLLCTLFLLLLHQLRLRPSGIRSCRVGSPAKRARCTFPSRWPGRADAGGARASCSCEPASGPLLLCPPLLSLFPPHLLPTLLFLFSLPLPPPLCLPGDVLDLTIWARGNKETLGSAFRPGRLGLK